MNVIFCMMCFFKSKTAYFCFYKLYILGFEKLNNDDFYLICITLETSFRVERFDQYFWGK